MKTFDKLKAGLSRVKDIIKFKSNKEQVKKCNHSFL